MNFKILEKHFFYKFQQNVQNCWFYNLKIYTQIMSGHSQMKGFKLYHFKICHLKEKIFTKIKKMSMGYPF